MIKKQTPKAPAGLKSIINKVISDLEKYEKNREEWLKSHDAKKPQFKRNGLISSNFKKVGTSCISDVSKLADNFHTLKINVDTLPCPICVGLVCANLLSDITNVSSMKKYADFFKRVQKKSAL